jgi:hypothetical protein
MVSATPLLHISAAETCIGLCLHAIGASGNHVVAYPYYNGSALRNRIVEVVLNHEYVANISTNYSGALSMYAPFSLGRNTISMRYEGNVVDYLLYYFGNYLSLVLLPVGASFYVFIRILSERKTSNKEVTIIFDDEQEGSYSKLDKTLVLDAAVQLRRRDARMSMVKALPVSVDEVSAALYELSGYQSSIGIEESVNSVCTDAYYGVLCRSAMPYREIAAKRLYETAMHTGSYVLKDGMSMSSFLKSNGVVHFVEMYSGLVRRLYGSNRVSISVSTCSEEKSIRALLVRCSRACAFLLFNELNGFVSVVGC